MFSSMQLAANQIGRAEEYRLPWNNAPKVLRDAIEAADKAIVDAHEALADIEEAEINASEIKNVWNAKAEALVRDGKPLPSRNEVEAAEFAVEIAKKDSTKAELEVRRTEAVLAGVLEEEKNRDSWVDGMQKQLDADQKRLSELSGETLTLVNRISQLRAYSAWLSVYPVQGQPEVQAQNELTTALNNALNVKLILKPSVDRPLNITA